jgi:hypothetical protein
VGGGEWMHELKRVLQARGIDVGAYHDGESGRRQRRGCWTEFTTVILRWAEERREQGRQGGSACRGRLRARIACHL